MASLLIYCNSAPCTQIGSELVYVHPTTTVGSQTLNLFTRSPRTCIVPGTPDIIAPPALQTCNISFRNVIRSHSAAKVILYDSTVCIQHKLRSIVLTPLRKYLHHTVDGVG